MSDAIRSALVAGLVSLVVGAATSWLAFRRLRREFLLEFQAESLVRRLLQHKRWRLRTFKTLKYHLAGFDDDELRRILVRCGAVRFQDNQGEEIWGLLERVGDLIEQEHGTASN